MPQPRKRKPMNLSQTMPLIASVAVLTVLHIPTFSLINSAHAQTVPSQKGELAGLFFGQESRNQLNFATNSYSYVLIKRWYYFLPGGRVYSGLPKPSLSAFNWQEALRTEPTHCGLYHLEGGKIRIAWQGGEKPLVQDFSRGDSTIRIGRLTLEQMISPVGRRLSTTYGASSFANTSNVFGSSGGVGSERKITFTEDGRFTEEGFVGFVQQSANDGADSSAGATGSQSSGGNGRYRITAEGMDLTYTDGRKARIPLLIPASANKNSQPEYILVNGAVYLRR